MLTCGCRGNTTIFNSICLLNSEISTFSHKYFSTNISSKAIGAAVNNYASSRLIIDAYTDVTQTVYVIIIWPQRRRAYKHDVIILMDDKRLPGAVLYGHVERTRSRGRQTKTWMDNIREDLRTQNMNIRYALDKIRDRTIWRRQVEASSLAQADGGERRR